MKLGGRERPSDEAALEELFASLPVTADWTIGFLTGVCTGPDAIGPTAWLGELMPEGAVDDVASAAARAKVDTLAKLYGAVVETLRTTPEIICPEPDKPAEEAAEFCKGYVCGARMHATWRDDEVATKMLVPFEALGEASADAQNAMDREKLGSYVAGVHTYWQSKRQVVNATPKVGRNEPCPCGSGKKHKKCCLAKQG